MTRITAKEARELAGPSVQERVDEVYPLIRKAAEEKRRQVNLHDWWADSGYAGTAEWRDACKILEMDGYKVKFFCDERDFFDKYTIVMW